ncbi:hypothetical protein ACWGOQ_0021205 [Aquimarina sp. M1]
MSKNFNHIIYNLTFLCLFVSNVYAQKPIGDVEPAIEVIGFVGKENIKLRWAPNTPLAWKYANQYGFYIERQTIVKEGKILTTPIIQRLHVMTIKPKPMAEWEQLVEDNDNAAIVAQAIYGEDFEVEMEEGGNGMLTILNQAQVLEQRFAFALYAADQDYEVAKFSGLGYVDNDVKPGERYLYKVFTEVPEEKMNIKFGGVYVGLQDYRELPKPQEFVGVFKDKSVMLSWNYRLLVRDYNSYVLEKSADLGQTFVKVLNVPITNLNNNKEQAASRMVYIDSLAQNNKEYHYRLKGISPFGETGPYSDVLVGKGVKGNYYNPAILKADISENQKSVKIVWEFPEEGKEGLSHFEVLRANEIKGNYVSIQQNIRKTSRTLQLQDIQPISYYKVVAVGNDGSRRESFPFMVQPDDATPPNDPKGLTGKIDTTGVVTLQWEQNTEPDLLGYRVFRANLEGEEFTQITFAPIKENKVIDSIPIKTLVKKIYYKVQAFDKRYNPSGFSEILMLRRPDIIPPTPPVFSKFKVEDNEVRLQWVPSSSEDAVKTIIYRKEKGTDQDWQLVTDQDISQTSYDDTTIQENTTYLYTAITQDDTGLESDPINPLLIIVPEGRVKPTIDRFTGVVDREQQNIMLNWKYKEKGITEFLLFKAQGNERPGLYKVFKNQEQKFTDTDLIINTNYQYLLQATFASGVKSPLKKIEVKY